MKIAIISDIHGNSFALDAVLKNIDADKIFCLGDLAMAGYDPNYTIEKIASLKNASVISGNTDKFITNYSQAIFEQILSYVPSMAYVLQEDIKIIKQENINYLRSLPEKLELEIEGIKICLCHGSPRRQDENIYPDIPVDEVETIVSGTGADIIFCGHTHLPCGFQLKSGKTVVNVGSVGRPMQENKTPVFATIQITNRLFEITHHYAQYDNQLAYNEIKKRGFPNCEDLAKMLIKE